MQPHESSKVSPGDVFEVPPARVWNNMVAAGYEYSKRELSNRATPPIRARETDLIRVLNDCGADRRVGEIMDIEGNAITDVREEFKWLVGVEPADGHFGILKEPLLDGKVGQLQVSGCCMAWVDVSDETHTSAAPSSGSYVLESATSGPIDILYAPSGTGEKNCVVRFAGSGGSGSGGGCTCCGWVNLGNLQHPNLPTGKDLTVREWTVTPVCGGALGTMQLPTEDGLGYVSFPGIDLNVVYEDTGDTFVLDLSDDVTVFENDGTDVTNTATITTAELVMEWPSSGDKAYVKFRCEVTI